MASPAVLSAKHKEQIKNILKKAFSKDFEILEPFHEKIGIKPPQAIVDHLIDNSDKTHIDSTACSLVVRKYFPKPKPSGNREEFQLHERIFSLQGSSCKVKLINTVTELVQIYPSFSVLRLDEDQELEYLLAFRNITAVCLEVLGPKDNDKLVMDIAGKLEGSGRKYSGKIAKESMKKEVVEDKEADPINADLNMKNIKTAFQDYLKRREVIISNEKKVYIQSKQRRTSNERPSDFSTNSSNSSNSYQDKVNGSVFIQIPCKSINISELFSKDKDDIEQLKHFISLTEDIYDSFVTA